MGAADGDDAERSPAARRAALLDRASPTVRDRVVEIVAAAVSELPAEELPAPVRPVARFTPSKRARLGAAALLAAVRADDGFADRLLAWGRDQPWWPTDGADPDATLAAAVAVLEGSVNAATLVAGVEQREELAGLRARAHAADRRAERLERELDTVRHERDEARRARHEHPPDQEAELTKLRARLREQGVRVRRAEEAAAAARRRDEDVENAGRAEHDRLARERDRGVEKARLAEERAARLGAELDDLRRRAARARDADDVRLRLLLDTVAGAVDGLRAELGLGRGGAPDAAHPADLVDSASPPPAPVTDTAALDRVLGLRSVHVLVDGYNVTKTAWPEQSLAAQRDRLVTALSPLAARTGAETTVVFDGAGVVGVPTPSARGVRVLFSDPGVLADDVLRRLVAAEPRGRPLVVVTSDRAVADDVRRAGAHPVASAVLLERLART